MRSLSLPAVSSFIVLVSNVNEVSVSPVWNIESAIPTPPFASIVLLAVIIPTESIFVTSSYCRVPPTDTVPDTFNDERVPTDVMFV